MIHDCYHVVQQEEKNFQWMFREAKKGELECSQNEI